MTEKSLLMNYVLDRTPALRCIIEKHGNLSLYEYAKRFYIGNQPAPRKHEFIEKIIPYLEWKYWKETSNLVTKSLSENYAVSTADHHGPIWHPFWFQAWILRGLVQTDSAIVNLSTSHVSLGNSSYPRGFVLQSDTQKMSQLLLPLFPASSRMSPVFRYTSFHEASLTNTYLKQLKQHLKKWYISKEKYIFLEQWTHRTLIQSEVLSEKYYSQQITLINASMWWEIFPHEQPLITLDSEELVIALLIHALEETNQLSELIIWWKWEEIEKNFNRISCCFDLEKKKWTYLFWYLDEHHMRHALWRNGNVLESPTCSVRILLEKNEVKEMLQLWNLIPSGLLVYSTLAGYYGIKCFGGFAQWSYLPAVITAYKQTTNDNRGGEATESILCEDLIFLTNSYWGITTALDMLYDTSTNWRDKLLLYAKNTALVDAVEPVLPEIARCISF